MKALLKALLKASAPLTSLNLEENDVDSGVELAAWLGAMASVTECKLRGNKLGVEGWTTIFNTLRDSTVSKITSWDLSNDNLGPGITKPLADYLAITASITQVMPN